MPIWRRLHSLSHPGQCLFTVTVGANTLDRRRMPFLLCQILLTRDKSRGKACMRWERFSQMWHLFLTCWKLRLCPSQVLVIKHLFFTSAVASICSLLYRAFLHLSVRHWCIALSFSSNAYQVRMIKDDPRLRQEKFRLHTRKKFFTERVAKQGLRRLPREVVMPPTLEVYKRYVDMGLTNMVVDLVVLSLWLNLMFSEVFSNLNYSLIPSCFTHLHVWKVAWMFAVAPHWGTSRWIS